MPNNVLLTPTERVVVATLSLLHAALFGWAAFTLPWTTWSWFTALSTLTALGHAVAFVACVAMARYAASAWRASSLCGLVSLVVVSVQVFSAGSYVARLYGQLGQGLFATLIAIWGLFVLVTVPFGVWGLVRTRGAPPSFPARWRGIQRRGTTLLVLCITLLVAASVGFGHAQARTTALVPSFENSVFEPVASALRANQTETTSSWMTDAESRQLVRKPAKCKTDVTQSVTVIASYGTDEPPRTRCFQADTLELAIARLAATLKRKPASGPVMIDVLTAYGYFDQGPAALDTLKLRPALDGACLGTRCIMPWQLLARGALTTNRPLNFVPDLKFGVSRQGLEDMLGKGESGLVRIETRSVIIDARGLVTTLRRMRPVDLPPSAENVQRAMTLAEAHVLTAQQPDGKFRYTLQPFTGKQETQNFSLARQAGTVFALCELGANDARTNSSIERAVALLASHEQKNAEGTLGGLTLELRPQEVTLASSALAWVSMLACRARLGKQFDGQIARLGQLVLSLQRPDGGFYPAYTLTANRVRAGKEPLYAPGQALLGLVLLAQQPDLNALGFDVERVNEAIFKGMDYVAQEHWDHALYPFFFIEENWHCLTAGAALETHRHSEYERFCLDYVRFKSRLILDHTSHVDAEFIGGFGFGNVIPPHNTGAAGFAEALSAAIRVQIADGNPALEQRRLLAQVAGFLLRQQWTPENCFGCDPLAWGAVSEHVHSPISRIDFVQHAWAGLAGFHHLPPTALPIGTAE